MSNYYYSTKFNVYIYENQFITKDNLDAIITAQQELAQKKKKKNTVTLLDVMDKKKGFIQKSQYRSRVVQKENISEHIKNNELVKFIQKMEKIKLIDSIKVTRLLKLCICWHKDGYNLSPFIKFLLSFDHIDLNIEDIGLPNSHDYFEIRGGSAEYLCHNVLYYAIRNNQMDIAHLLVDNGADLLSVLPSIIDSISYSLFYYMNIKQPAITFLLQRDKLTELKSIQNSYYNKANGVPNFLNPASVDNFNILCHGLELLDRLFERQKQELLELQLHIPNVMSNIIVQYSIHDLDLVHHNWQYCIQIMNENKSHIDQLIHLCEKYIQ